MSDAAKPDHPDTALVLEYEFDAPPAKVWRAVTIPALRERWLPDCDLAGCRAGIIDRRRRSALPAARFRAAISRKPRHLPDRAE